MIIPTLERIIVTNHFFLQLIMRINSYELRMELKTED